MKVYIDLQDMMRYPGGIPIYIKNLINYSAAINPDTDFYSGLATLNLKNFNNLDNLIKTHIIPKVKFKKIYLPGRLVSQSDFIGRILTYPWDVDIYHCPANSYYGGMLPVKYKKFVLTICDIVFMIKEQEKYAPRGYIDLMKDSIHKAIKKADAVITISNFTKKEICANFDVNPRKIYPIYLASQFDDTSIVKSEKSTVMENLNMTQYSYFLSVGTICIRKNFERLIKAFLQFSFNKPDIRLVLVGRKDPSDETEKISRLINENSDRVIYIEMLNDSDLISLYQNAKAFFLVSNYEGFGMPLLEAMNLGCPVCFASGSSMDEIAGEAGLVVNPNSTEEIIEAMNQYYFNDILRVANIEKGLLRAKEFSWKRCAQETLNLYKNLLNE